MKLKYYIYSTLICSIMLSCAKKQSSPFNYELIKSKLNLTDAKTKAFDEVTTEYTEKIKNNFQSSTLSKEEKMKTAKQISSVQDSLIKMMLSVEKFEIYKTEIAIERKGRDQHNMSLIKNKLNLDSVQKVKYEAANKAFYTTLIDNHDYYHGKPDMYLQFYNEIDVNRQQLFEKLLNKNQLERYNKLKTEYKIGKSEH